jgi:RimJ/RimL family protein N-acetyltransferase
MADSVDRYPTGWTGVEVLRDGGAVRIRPVLPDDGPALEALHGRLSPDAVFFRYFTSRRVLPQRQIDRFVNVDYRDQIGFVVETLDGEVIAHGCYFRNADTDEADAAFEVQNDHWGRGLGTLLLGRLALAARHNGLHRLTAQVMPENHRMLEVFHDSGLPVKSTFGDGLIEIAIELDALDVSRQRISRAKDRRIGSPAPADAADAPDAGGETRDA